MKSSIQGLDAGFSASPLRRESYRILISKAMILDICRFIRRNFGRILGIEGFKVGIWRICQASSHFAETWENLSTTNVICCSTLRQRGRGMSPFPVMYNDRRAFCIVSLTPTTCPGLLLVSAIRRANDAAAGGPRLRIVVLIRSLTGFGGL